MSIGLTGAGIIGVAPAFVGSRFDTTLRATGWGLVYHLASAIGAFAPFAIGKLQDSGWALATAMAAGIGGASLVAVVLTLGVRPRTQIERLIDTFIDRFAAPHDVSAVLAFPPCY